MAEVKQVLNKHAEVLEAMALLANTRVMVGVPATEALRNPEPGEKTQPNNAMLAYILENGCPAAHIPPRPFLRPAVAALQPEIERRLKQTAAYAMQGRPEAVEKSLMALPRLCLYERPEAFIPVERFSGPHPRSHQSDR